MKAKLPRSEASSKKAKAKVRASSVVIKKAPVSKVVATKAAKLVKPVAATKAQKNGSSATPAKAPASADRGHAIGKATSAAKSPVVAAPTPAKRGEPAKPTSAKPVEASKPAKPLKSGAAAPSVKASSTTAVAPPAPAPVVKKPARKSIKEAAGVSTDAVARRTGKTWDDWFEVLDSAGAQTLDQRGIIAILAQKHGIGPWWQQMIAVGYESLRAKPDKPAVSDGFQISKSCTLDAPVTRVFKLWNDPGERARWLSDERFVVRGATTDRVIRARWGKGSSHVAVSFSEKSGKTEVSVEHHQIESRSAAEQMKAYWAKKLGLLDEALGHDR